MSGTSMAGPYVSGVAALMLSINPNLNGQQLKERILDSARYVPYLEDLCVTDGKLDSYRALHDHSFTYSQITMGNHTRSCSCGISKTEAHTLVSSSSGFFCSKCGYTSNIGINSAGNTETE